MGGGVPGASKGRAVLASTRSDAVAAVMQQREFLGRARGGRRRAGPDAAAARTAPHHLAVVRCRPCLEARGRPRCPTRVQMNFTHFCLINNLLTLYGP